MSYVITKDCIGCHLCQSECPTNAIESHDGVLSINSSVCNDCVGYYGTPQCASICPTNQGCIPSVSNSVTNYWEDWFARYNMVMRRLKTQKQGVYWQKWFDTYSQRLTLLQSDS